MINNTINTVTIQEVKETEVKELAARFQIKL